MNEKTDAYDKAKAIADQLSGYEAEYLWELLTYKILETIEPEKLRKQLTYIAKDIGAEEFTKEDLESEE